MSAVFPAVNSLSPVVHFGSCWHYNQWNTFCGLDGKPQNLWGGANLSQILSPGFSGMSLVLSAKMGAFPFLPHWGPSRMYPLKHHCACSFLWTLPTGKTSALRSRRQGRSCANFAQSVVLKRHTGRHTLDGGARVPLSYPTRTWMCCLITGHTTHSNHNYWSQFCETLGYDFRVLW